MKQCRKQSTDEFDIHHMQKQNTREKKNTQLIIVDEEKTMQKQKTMELSK